MDRKLAAILSADVQGYSRLMGEDEEATVQTLTAYREVMVSLIRQHRGRVVDSPGDNLLAEFASMVDAVQCALGVQRELNARNRALPDSRHPTVVAVCRSHILPRRLANREWFPALRERLRGSQLGLCAQPHP
jgi:class 3 adenylate cyclase